MSAEECKDIETHYWEDDECCQACTWVCAALCCIVLFGLSAGQRNILLGVVKEAFSCFTG